MVRGAPPPPPRFGKRPDFSHEIFCATFPKHHFLREYSFLNILLLKVLLVIFVPQFPRLRFERQATSVAACCGLGSGLSPKRREAPILSCLLPPYKSREQVADQLLNHPLPPSTVSSLSSWKPTICFTFSTVKPFFGSTSLR